MVQIKTPELNKLVAETEKALRDSAYVVVGLGVLSFQSAQVRRRELAKQLQAEGGGLASQINETADKIGGQLSTVGDRLATNLSAGRGQLTELAKSVDGRVAPTRAQIDQQVDAFEERLPASARTVFTTVRTVLSTPEAALRNAVGLTTPSA
jgi:hypothetical protein